MIFGFPGLVSAAKITNLERLHYSGHVFDLQDEILGLYTVNGVLVHNCACTGIPVLKSWGELLGPEYAGMKDEGIDEWEMKTRDPESGKIASVTVQPYDEWLGEQ